MGAEWVLVTRTSLGCQTKCQQGAHLGLGHEAGLLKVENLALVPQS